MIRHYSLICCNIFHYSWPEISLKRPHIRVRTYTILRCDYFLLQVIHNLISIKFNQINKLIDYPFNEINAWSIYFSYYCYNCNRKMIKANWISNNAATIKRLRGPRPAISVLKHHFFQSLRVKTDRPTDHRTVVS